MICNQCAHVFRVLGEGPIPNHEAEHYSQFRQLDESANAGCGVCALFRTVLLDYYAQKLSLSIEKARLRHQKYDEATDPEISVEANTRFSRKSNDSKDTTKICHYPFKVRPRSCGIKPSSEFFVKGLQGLNYVRVKPHGEELDNVYPYLHLTSLSGNIAFPWRLISGRALSYKPDFQLAQQWIDHCSKTHIQCRQQPETPLPTRVLDLRPLGVAQDLQLMTSNGENGSYAALSHCWGKTRPMVLTSKTARAFCERISFSKLPQTFRDAVVAARRLGLNFLWIDSLCIIQDSKKDWEEQCAKMASIYKNAFVTLAGPEASDCNSGFPHSRPLLAQETLPSLNLALYHHGTNKRYFESVPEFDCPLAKRGWVLQERLLSSRILYFGSTGMYYECFEHCHCPTTNHLFEPGQVPKSMFRNTNAILDYFAYWRMIIKTYSNMSLTKPTDRLPALSGIAFEISEATGAEYLAGIWRQDIPSSLTWYIPEWAWARTPPVPSTKDYIAPSWSWAAAQQGCEFPNQKHPNPFDSDIELVESQISLAGLDKFGAVKDGYIRVRGRIARIFVYKDSGVSGLRARPLMTDWKYSSDVGLSEHLAYFPDSKQAKGDCEILLILLGQYKYSNRLVALAIEPTECNPNEYRRIGLAYTVLSRKVILKLFEESDRHEIRII